MSKYERVDLGNVRGKQGISGIDGVGIDSIEDLGYLDPNNPFDRYYQIIWTDSTKEPINFKVKDGEDLSIADVVQLNNKKAVTSDAVYKKLLAKADITHLHGDIKGDGTITNSPVAFDGNDRPLVSDNSNNNRIQRGSVSSDYIVDSNSYQCIGSSAESTQTTINGKIDTAINTKLNKSINLNPSENNEVYLDNIRDTGFYYSIGNTATQWVYGKPKADTSFYLIVEQGTNGNYVKQTWTHYNQNVATVYVRTCNNNVWGKWQEQQSTNNGHEYVTSTHQSSTNEWTGTCQHITELKVGTVIYYCLNQNPSTSNTTLDLTLPTIDDEDPVTTGAKNILMFDGSNIRNNFPKGSVIGLVYSGYNWWVINPFILSSTNSDIKMDGNSASSGTSYKIARADHIHPHDDTKLNVTDTIPSSQITNSGALGTIGTDSGATQEQINQYFNTFLGDIDTTLAQQGAITVQSELTEDSANPVKSSGIYSVMKNKVDKGDIGGGNNLLRGSPNSTLSSTGSPNDYTTKSETYHKGKIYNINNSGKASSAYSDIMWYVEPEDFTYNEVFTLSFYAKGTSGQNLKTYFYGDTGYIGVKRISSNSTVSISPSGGFGDGVTEFALTTDWKKHYVTYKLDSNGTQTSRKKLAIRVFGGAEADISNVQLERGYNATDYSHKADIDHTHYSTDIKSVHIPTGEDLNTYTSTGFYYNHQNSQSSGISNLAENGKAFFLQVEDWGTSNYTKQTITHYGTKKTYVRIRNNGTWGKWVEQSREVNNIHTFTDEVTVAQSESSSNEYILLDNDYYFNNTYDWTVTGEIKVTGHSTRFEIHKHNDTNLKNFIGVGKNNTGKLAFWWGTSSSAESSKSYTVDDMADNEWYTFSISKRGIYVIFNFNDTYIHTLEATYFNTFEWVTPRVFKYATNSISVRNVKIYPNTPSNNLIGCIEIQPNTDLNNLTHQANGFYRCGLSVTAQSLSNCPVTTAFNLMVYQMGIGNNQAPVRQELRPYRVDSNEQVIYARNYYGGTWESWHMYAPVTDNVSDIKMNGTASVGTNYTVARSDHIHPHDTSMASNTLPKVDSYYGDGIVGTSTSYARADHQHTKTFVTSTGGTREAGYVNILQIQLLNSWQDLPLVMTVTQRAKKSPTYLTIKFTNTDITSETNPDYKVDQFTAWGTNTEFYLMQVDTNTFNLMAYKVKDDQYKVIDLYYGGTSGNATITPLNTSYGTSAPTSTTTNPIVKANWQDRPIKDFEGSANILGIASYNVSGGNLMTDGGLHNGHRAVRINNTDKAENEYTQLHWTLPNGFHQYNEVYTLSFWAKGTSGKYVSVYFGGSSGYVTVKRINSNSTITDDVTNSSKFPSTYGDGHTKFALTSNWQHFFVTYQLNSSGDLTKTKQPIIRVWGGTDAYISSPKLEKGHNATDWTPSVLNAETIYPNMDLNDFTMKGKYHCPLTAWANQIANTPMGVAFSLEVAPTTDSGCVQTFTAFMPENVYKYERTYYNNKWGNWQHIVNEPKIVSTCDTNGSGANSGGFAKLCKIYVNSTYYNTPIVFNINQRKKSRPVTVFLRFANVNSKNPEIEYFKYTGEDTDIYICNEESQYYTVYVRKMETNDVVEVQNLRMNDGYTGIVRKVEVIPLNDQVTEANMPYQTTAHFSGGVVDKKATRGILNGSYTTSVDWNTLKEPGAYSMPWRQISADQSNADSNRPTINGGTLVIMDTFSGYDQFFIVYGGTPNIWMRHYYSTNGTWYPWKKIVNWQQSEEYIESTHTSATSTWLGTSETLLGIEKGTRIYYKLNQNPSTSNVTLNLTLGNGSTTGAKNVFRTGNVRVSNQYANGDVIPLIYDGSAWRVIHSTSHSHGNISNDGKIGSSSGQIITTTTNGVLTASSTITKSKISDFPTSMTPTSHTHGNISNDGKIGSSSGKIITTGANGTIQSSEYYKYTVIAPEYNNNGTIITDTYNVKIDSTIPIECSCKDATGNAVSGKTLTLWKNGESLGTATTNANGVATWNVVCDTWGIIDFSVEDSHCQVFVDGWRYVNGSVSSSYAVLRNRNRARFILNGWTQTYSMNTTWSTFGSTTASTVKPQTYVLLINSQASAYFRVNKNGGIDMRTVTGTLASGTQHYGEVEWNLD